MSSSYVTVTVSGPIFDGRAQAASDQWVKDTELKLAQQAQSIIQGKARRFDRSGRGGTGRAASSVDIRNDGGAWVVAGQSNRGQVWWPWLEGTSHRNQTTRFKGYHVFRLAKNIIAKRWRQLAQAELDKYLGRMN